MQPLNDNTLPIISDDPWLKPYEEDLKNRKKRVLEKLAEIDSQYGSLVEYASSDLFFGFNESDEGIWYREWAPYADSLCLIGDFNDWNKSSHPLEKDENGVWSILLDKGSIKHKSLVKVAITANGEVRDRIPAYIKRAVQDQTTKDFAGQYWKSDIPYNWKNDYPGFKKDQAPLVYECHVGMAQEAEAVGSYKDFADLVLPRIAKLGYNCIQIMAIQEHPYYGSYGYHVSNFYAPSSRFGTPEDLKYLIDTAHGYGIACLLDVVHSHAVKNINDGLNDFDGSKGQYFHEGERGEHVAWDSMLFNYAEEQVQRFLLSNLKYWMEEFQFDGFRFDGITSMLYEHHGYQMTFNHYDQYFKNGVDHDAILYLQMANTLIHELNPNALSIAEDYSGMPGGCRLIEDGGLGFDYRLAMGLPDYWIKLLKHKADEDWNIFDIWQSFSNRRYKEPVISYVESHDQGMVGDKTTAFWLMDQDMYWYMNKASTNLVIDRGIALHKMMRLFTAVAGGEGYLNFIGNEFGHPEWLDFPRKGNDWSHKHARRQWSLVDNKDLRYHELFDFDVAMLTLLKDTNVLSADAAQKLNMDAANQTIICERGNLIFIFNFSPTNSVSDYKFFVPKAGSFNIVLNSDDAEFGGFGRVDNSIEYFSANDEHGTPYLRLYVPNRTTLVLKKIT